MAIHVTEKRQTVYAEVHGHDGKPIKNGPKAIQVVVTARMAAQIRRYAQFVKENELYKVQRFDWPVWLAEMPIDKFTDQDIKKSPHRTSVETLNINADEFWYEACVKDTDIDLISDRISIASLDI